MAFGTLLWKSVILTSVPLLLRDIAGIGSAPRVALLMHDIALIGSVPPHPPGQGILKKQRSRSVTNVYLQQTKGAF